MSARELHEHFEELSALAAIGQISPEEYRELQSHLKSCAACRVKQEDFSEILHEHLPLLDSQEATYAQASNVAFHDASYKRRFVERARAEGIHFSDEVLGKKSTKSGTPPRWQRLSSLLQPQRLAYSAALLALGIGIGMFKSGREGVPSLPQDPENNPSRFQAEIRRLNHRIVELTQLSESAKIQEKQQASLPAPIPHPGNDKDAIQNELARVRQNYTSAVAKAEELDSQLQKASAELASLRDGLSRVRNEAP